MRRYSIYEYVTKRITPKALEAFSETKVKSAEKGSFIKFKAVRLFIYRPKLINPTEASNSDNIDVHARFHLHVWLVCHILVRFCIFCMGRQKASLSANSFCCAPTQFSRFRLAIQMRDPIRIPKTLMPRTMKRKHTPRNSK